MSQTEFARGFYFNTPPEAAPDYVLGKVSINKEQFLGWLESQEANEKGYVRLDVKRSRDGKIYASLDNWKPSQSRASADPVQGSGYTQKSSASAYRAAKEGVPFNDTVEDIPFMPHERGWLC